MKKAYAFVPALLLICMLSQSSAQCIKATPCFSDGFGYVYHFSNPQLVGVNVYAAEGTSTGYPAGTATMKLDLTNGISNGTVRIVIRNGAADGCVSYSDSFIYVGTAQLVKGSDNIVTSFSGSGSWTSYCFGAPLFTGTWFASGPCGSGTLKQATGISPVDGKQKTADYNKGVTSSPNPTNSSTTIGYSVKTAGKANVTVYNSMNQPVKVLVNEVKPTGNYSTQWNLLNNNGTKVPAGIYRVILTTPGGTFTNNVQVIAN